eukprot:jgi/Chlat1/7985/Chrsp7S00627
MSGAGGGGEGAGAGAGGATVAGESSLKTPFQTRLPAPPGSARRATARKENIAPAAAAATAAGTVGRKRKLSPTDAPTQMFHAGGARSEQKPLAKRPALASSCTSLRELKERDVNVPKPLTDSWESLNDDEVAADVEALLAKRIVAKSKFDYKATPGKCELQTEYIRELRACVKYLQETNNANVACKANLQKKLAIEMQLSVDKVQQMKIAQDGLERDMEALRGLCTDFEHRLMDSDREKADLQSENDDAHAALKTAQDEIARSEVDLLRVRADLSKAQIDNGNLQECIQKLQDYNGSLQEYNSSLQKDVSAFHEEKAALQQDKATLQEELGAFRGQSTALQGQLELIKSAGVEAERAREALVEERARLTAELRRCIEERDNMSSQLQTLSADNARYRECTGKSAAEMQSLETKAMALEESYTTQADLVSSLRHRIHVANAKVELAEERLADKEKECDRLNTRCTELEADLVEAERVRLEGETLRRKLHNQIQELKGNIRVFCRVRPAGVEENASSSMQPAPILFPQAAELQGRGIELVPTPGAATYPFTFDRVFDGNASQGEVFVEISELVQSALDGYKVCIFAYGQTGSGKTFTMLGSSDAQGQGIVPRSLQQIFEISQALAQQGWKFSMQASMLEIYNESLQDLLGNSLPQGKQHIIKHDPLGNTAVTDLTCVQVTSAAEVSSLLQHATAQRSVGKTAMNERSSRSHCVFTLRIDGENTVTSKQVRGVLNLIDLAGSERLSRSQATGDRLKETQAINKSLSSLGDVISAIANKEQHIPYRNSKLTYLLQPCLGGDSKTLMFVNVAPTRESMPETLCSLRFASKVNSCEIGVPRRQVKVDSKLG